MGKLWHLAQYNIARMRALLDDPSMAEFLANLHRLNSLADGSPGFVWRHQEQDGTSTSVRVRNDERIIINLSVWDSVEALFEFTYRSEHVEFYRRRRDWFEHIEQPYLVLWWVPAGSLPKVDEAEARLDHLITHGSTPYAFTFKQRFPPPDMHY